ncbi:MAG: hypothetical protein K1X75_16620 [Leptospirales bacterium]|nr:hypothetical protein [Leptospirales bacterium]
MLWDILWRNRNSFSLTFCIGFSLISLLWQRNPFSQGMGYFGRLADRFTSTLNSGLSFGGAIWVELDKYRELEQRYEQAQKALEEHRLEKDKFDLLRRENEKLREALGFLPSADYPEVRAQVIGARLNTLSPRIIINRGADQGVTPLMPVIARAHDANQNLIRCLVGVIVSVDSSTAVVQPLVHPGFQMGVRIGDSGQWAILNGNSGRSLEPIITFITADSDPNRAILSHTDSAIPKDQIVYSSGEGGVFPAGIPIGFVRGEGPRENDFRTAYIQPIAPIENLDIVSVLLKRPTPWSSGWDQRERWEEHLETEFGPPVYTDSTLRETARRRRDNDSGAAPTNAAQSAPQPLPEANPVPNPGAAAEKPGETQQPPRRRIQNFNLPSPGAGNP